MISCPLRLRGEQLQLQHRHRKHFGIVGEKVITHDIVQSLKGRMMKERTSGFRRTFVHRCPINDVEKSKRRPKWQDLWQTFREKMRMTSSWNEVGFRVRWRLCIKTWCLWKWHFQHYFRNFPTFPAWSPATPSQQLHSQLEGIRTLYTQRNRPRGSRKNLDISIWAEDTTVIMVLKQICRTSEAFRRELFKVQQPDASMNRKKT